MTAPVNQEIIERIKKLQALSESSNPNEAALALQRISEMLIKYNLEITDITEKQDNHNAAISSGYLQWHGGVFRMWEWDILESICTAFLCAPINYRKEKSFRIIGTPDNITIVRDTAVWVFEQLDRMAELDFTIYRIEYFRNHMEWPTGKENYKISWFNDYFTGAAVIIKKKLGENPAIYDPNYRGLVLYNNGKVKRFIAEEIGKISHRTTYTSLRNGAAYTRGQEAGGRVSFGRQQGKIGPAKLNPGR